MWTSVQMWGRDAGAGKKRSEARQCDVIARTTTYYVYGGRVSVMAIQGVLYVPATCLIANMLIPRDQINSNTARYYSVPMYGVAIMPTVVDSTSMIHNQGFTQIDTSN